MENLKMFKAECAYVDGGINDIIRELENVSSRKNNSEVPDLAGLQEFKKKCDCLHKEIKDLLQRTRLNVALQQEPQQQRQAILKRISSHFGIWSTLEGDVSVSSSSELRLMQHEALLSSAKETSLEDESYRDLIDIETLLNMPLPKL